MHLPERHLDDEEAQLVRNGRPLKGDGEGPMALWTGAGDLVGVGVADAGTIRPETVVA